VAVATKLVGLSRINLVIPHGFQSTANLWSLLCCRPYTGETVGVVLVLPVTSVEPAGQGSIGSGPEVELGSFLLMPH
jgi:hypothetical protein